VFCDKSSRHLAISARNQTAALFQLYLKSAGFSHITAAVLAYGRGSDPLIAITARA
jgi:hypothetical protein